MLYVRGAIASHFVNIVVHISLVQFVPQRPRAYPGGGGGGGGGGGWIGVFN